MKKIALTSLLAIFAGGAASAANVIDGNPLYMPKAGHFYSTTSIDSHSVEGRTWALGEEFGYGITNKLAVLTGIELAEKAAFEDYAWSGFKIGAAYRAFDKGAWKADLIGSYSAFGGLAYHERANNESKWFDKDAVNYTWAAGVRGGYVSSNWTLAGHAIFNYTNTETFNWNEGDGKMGEHTLALGLDAQYVFCPKLSMLAGVEYTGRLDKHYNGGDVEVENEGVWTGTLGVNYNIDTAKYVGLYVKGAMNHWKGEERALRSEKGWGLEKGFGFGAKFGIDF